MKSEKFYPCIIINAEGVPPLMLTPCQYRRWQMPDSYRKFGPMPAIVQPVRRPPTAPAMNGQMVFKAALRIPAQSISSFMFRFLSWFWLWCCWVVGWWVGAMSFAPCKLLLGGTCETRKTRGTFDFQEENA